MANRPENAQAIQRLTVLWRRADCACEFRIPAIYEIAVDRGSICLRAASFTDHRGADEFLTGTGESRSLNEIDVVGFNQ